MTWLRRRAVLPFVAFAIIALAHVLWFRFFPEQEPAQSRWVAAPAPAAHSWLIAYRETRSYWIGFSYALSAAFAVHAFRVYRERQSCAARNLAVGGVTLTGFLALAGCYLAGCCGSPMAAVYLGLFGSALLPLGKPLVAGVTALSIGIAWLWMRRRTRACCDQRR